MKSKQSIHERLKDLALWLDIEADTAKESYNIDKEKIYRELGSTARAAKQSLLDLGMMCRRVTHRLPDGHPTKEDAIKFLRENDHMGSILRKD